MANFEGGIDKGENNKGENNINDVINTICASVGDFAKKLNNIVLAAVVAGGLTTACTTGNDCSTNGACAIGENYEEGNGGEPTPKSTPVTTPVSTPVTTPVSTPVTKPVSKPEKKDEDIDEGDTSF